MSETIARPVVKNKYWIVETSGNKVATIQAIEEGGFVYVHNEQREKFSNIKILSKKYNIKFDKISKLKLETNNDVYGYPCTTKSYNKIYDVARKLPIFSKSAKSRSYFCAGYYLVKYSNNWVSEFCPKLITLNRYEYMGPFKTAQEAQEKQNG
jgi:hypothetical protein